ncbi:efflux RND transporter periplasmic adaptor subunit [Rhodopirellula sp. MGV]|uniref:efflux RND transporter periplasmic adaptor subunit n=1 Tax=Rhodopirellula sp. MGV TaxID=2023130 RepID=UPI000B964E4F|nr:efflux RND transporter periplasmic adaptor subunit [Rhodopirellula sp. MGV]OYP35807.1 hypothetical protein CGZ80_10430 [Rhodopirellula sp. MGV]PNY36380.1 hypothetical protein C2E31_13180 [Rhodopirellula baltica]
MDHTVTRIVQLKGRLAIAFVLLTLANCPGFSRHACGEEIAVESVLIRLADQVDVPARAVGSLLRVDVHEGSVVAKGQTLALIDDSESQLEMARSEREVEIAKLESEDEIKIKAAKNQFEHASRQYQRLLRVKQASNLSVSDSELDQAHAEMEQADFAVQQADSELKKAAVQLKLSLTKLELAKRNVEIRKIVSPQDGMVVESIHQAGEWVTPGETIFRVVDTKRLRVDGFIDAHRASDALLGRQVQLDVIGWDRNKSRFNGTVVFVSPENDPVTEQVKVTAEIDNQAGRLRPGLRATMTIDAVSVR